ncbi:DUF3103 family protein [Stenotrophomonas sp. SORGH_AS_0321]|uniref:DUF3103 family protein n=1 Tax=Stenotrophomonas sp. SORGH_AS_0321 TaxID=3041787 RepID=UPI00285EC0A8|nr:DUF3103 family protein [Stenotrophomonas sp. SORGH_AS_0321]MDR6095268.1 hypothetical protein [Stenotrophomonas sp. SORGH_AS_0321]
MKMNVCVLAITLAIASVSAASPAAASPTTPDSVPAVLASTSAEVTHLLRQPGFIETAISAMRDKALTTVAVSEVLATFDPGMRGAASAQLIDAERRLRELKGLPAVGAPLMQLRLVMPADSSVDDVDARRVRVAATPIGDDRHWTKVSARGADGSVVDVDSDTLPPFPLLMVGIDTRAALHEGLAVVNEGLREKGLQTLGGRRAGEALELTVLDKIRLKVDQEPNIKGAAEIFAIESGIQVDEAKAEMRTFEMPWLDYDKTDYYPNQELVVWNKYRFGLANIQMFEEDGNTNYKTMLSGLLAAVTVAIGPFQPTVALVGRIADEVLKIMPDGWFVDDHDYVESFYLLRKGQTYVDHTGAAGNATVSLSPLVID